MTNPDRVYWDANTYLNWLTGEHASLAVMQMVYDDWKKGLVTMVTSTLTLAEVYFVRLGTPKRVDRSKDKDIDALFDPPADRRFVLVELDRTVAVKARDLARAFSISGRDAIHIASALKARCPVMHTHDEALWAKSGLVGGEPSLAISAPDWTVQLAVQENIEPGSFTKFSRGPSAPEQPS